MGHTYTLFRTDVPNALGGYMTYSSLIEAANSLKGRATAIFAATYEIVPNPTYCLCRVLWEDRIY